MNGSCIVNGVVNDEMLSKNLETAIDVYISEVHLSPCAGTPIHLWKGVKNVKYQEERTVVNTFLKGTKKENVELKNALLSNTEGVGSEKKAYVTWSTKKLCFFLVCCYEHDRVIQSAKPATARRFTGSQVARVHWFYQ